MVHIHQTHQIHIEGGSSLAKYVVAFYNTFKAIPKSTPSRLIFALDLKIGYFQPRDFSPKNLKGEVKKSYEEATSLITSLDQAKSWGSFKASLLSRILDLLSILSLSLIILIFLVWVIWMKYLVHLVRQAILAMLCSFLVTLVALPTTTVLMLKRSALLTKRQKEFNQILERGNQGLRRIRHLKLESGPYGVWIEMRPISSNKKFIFNRGPDVKIANAKESLGPSSVDAFEDYLPC